MDVYVADGEPPDVVVEIDAAGVDPDRIDISLHGDVLVCAASGGGASAAGASTTTPRSPGARSSAA